MSKRRDRICYVLPLHDEQTEQHFFYLYDFLRRVSAEADLFLIVEKAAGEVAIENVQRTYVQRFEWSPLRALEMLAVMAWAVCRGYRKVYTHYSTFGGMASVLCRLLGARAYYWNCEENAGHFRKWRGIGDLQTLRVKMRIEWPTAFIIKSVHRLVTGTPTMARYYERTYGISSHRTRVMPNWIDPARIKADQAKVGASSRELRANLKLPEEVPVALFVHRLAPRKGSRELPGLIAGDGVEQLHWVICGDGPDRDWLSEQVEEQGLAHRVRILGNIPNREIVGFYRMASVLVMPSHQEGFPRVLLEAQACGLPFVATDVGGVRDVVGTLARERMVAPRGDFQGVSERIRQVLADSELRQGLVKEGFENVLRYDVDRTVSAFRAIMDEPVQV